MVNFFRSEDFVDGVGMEKTEVVIVHLELARLYADDQVGEHWVSVGSEGMLGLYINLFIYNLSMKVIG